MILSAVDILWGRERKLFDCCICARYLYTSNSVPLCGGRDGGSLLLNKHTTVIFFWFPTWNKLKWIIFATAKVEAIKREIFWGHSVSLSSYRWVSNRQNSRLLFGSTLLTFNLSFYSVKKKKNWYMVSNLLTPMSLSYFQTLGQRILILLNRFFQIPTRPLRL